MGISEERQEYLKEYRKNSLKRIPFEVPHELYDRIKAAAEIDGLSVNRYLRSLAIKDLNEKSSKLEEQKNRLDAKPSNTKQPSGSNFLQDVPPQRYKKTRVLDPNGHGYTILYTPEN